MTSVYILHITHRRPKLSGSTLLIGAVISQMILLSGTTIQPADHVRNLGLIIDKDLTMEAHISNVVSVSPTFASYASSDAHSLMLLLTRWYVLWFSRHDYCNNLFAGLLASQLTHLQSVLGAAARFVLRLPGRASVTDAIWLAALVLLPTASDVQVVPAGVQVSPRSGTRLSSSVLCLMLSDIAAHSQLGSADNFQLLT